jgi:hypothetical protein
MIGPLLLLAALGVAGLLGAILVVVIRAKLRERQGLARAVRPGSPDPQSAEASAAPRKPPLVPWLVVSAIVVAVVTLAGGMLLRSCQAIGEGNARERDRGTCRSSLEGLAQWLYADWEQRKALPPASAVPAESAVRCPLGNRFKYLGERTIPLGNERLLVIETGAHPVRGGGLDRHAIVADPKFLAAGKTGAEYQAAAGGGGGNSGYAYYGLFFKVRALSEVEYSTVSQAVEEVP